MITDQAMPSTDSRPILFSCGQLGPWLATLTLGWFLAFSTLHAAPRTWTNHEGVTMEAELVAVDGDHAVFSREGRTYRYPLSNLIEADQEHIRQQAQALAERARQEAEARQREEARLTVARALKGNLMRLERSQLRRVADDAIESKRLFAVYYSAAWCGPCRAFTPELVSFYDEVRQRHPEFEIIFVSSDRDENEMRHYMNEYRMNWPAVRFDRARSLDITKQWAARGIPNLVFVDGSGEVLASSYVGGRYVGPRHVLGQIRTHLASRD